MYTKIFVFIVFNLILTSNCITENNFVCTDSICENYREVEGCERLDLACRVQNSTHNGIIMKSPTKCGCCEYCLENLKLNDYCSLGALGTPIPKSICGPGLTCKSGGDHPTCQPMTTSTCHKKQIEFDKNKLKGTIGHLQQRPSCDDDGDYSPVVCIPGQMCYCVDKKGKRIFGEAVFSANIQLTMHCECSRFIATMPSVIDINYPVLTARCNERGSYDALQCIGDNCVCVDPKTGSPTSNLRNMTRGLSALPCYNDRIHQNFTFDRECETIKKSRSEEIYSFESMGHTVLKSERDFCQPDGWYHRIQEDDKLRYCADKYGKQIQNYSAVKGTVEAQQMNCNCARARKLLLDRQSIEVPECCPNGNYKKYTCRRGECYCLDSDGNQLYVEVLEHKMDTLRCFNGGNPC